MQIQGSQLQFSSRHVAEQQERLSLHVERRPAARESLPEAASGEGIAALDEVTLDPKLEPLVRLIEWLTGRRVQLFDVTKLAADEEPRAAARGDTQRSSATRYYREVELTQFSAEGELLTSDGERIHFSLRLDLARSYQEISRIDSARSGGNHRDPLVINLDVPSASLSSQRFRFDLDGDGRDESLPSLGRGSGYLVLDRNGNGRVDDGSELFGVHSGDGFADLATLDADGNGWIDDADPAFASLRIWQQGVAGARLQTLAEAGIAALSTASVATPFALRGERNADLGALRSTGVYLASDRSVGTLQQIDLTV